MHWLLMPMVAFAVAQEPNEAEKLFRASEKKLADADTVQITVNLGTKLKSGEMKLKGTVLIANGNKARAEMTGEFEGRSFKMTTLSNGTKWKTDATMGEGIELKGSVQDTPKNAKAIMAGVTSRSGFIAGYFIVADNWTPGKNLPELDNLIAVSDFSLGKKEKIRERQGHRIDYKLTFSSRMMKKETFSAQVWLDSETNLPLKRVVNMQENGEKFQVIEIYDIRLNAKIEASNFELRK